MNYKNVFLKFNLPNHGLRAANGLYDFEHYATESVIFHLKF